MNNKSLPWIRVETKLTITLPNGHPKTVSEVENKKLFDQTIEYIKSGQWDKIPDLLDTKSAIFNFSDGNFEVVNGVVHVQGKPVPNGLSKKIIAFAKENLPYKPLLKFWDKLNKNPSFYVVNSLYEFLEKNDYPITDDGDIIAYKGVRNDWTDNYTGTILNTIGTTVSMPRNEVDNNPDKSCSNGFHVGNYTFATSYSNNGHMIMASVDPENVVSMPNAYDFTKMRVCSYSILKEVFAEEKGNLYQKETIDNSEEDEYDNDSYMMCDCFNYDCEEYGAHHNSCECKLLDNDSSCSFKNEI